MKTIIIGSGLIGLASAWFLRRRGHEVMVLDAADGPGEGTSFANGALLTPSMSDPWNAPGCWRVLLASLGRSDAPMQLRLSALPSLAGWGLQFLRNSAVEAFRRNTLSNFRLANRSLELMALLRSETGIDYDRTACGTLRIFRNAAALTSAHAEAESRADAGLRFRSLTTSEVMALEPALQPIAAELAGAIHYQDDESGDAYRFCSRLKEVAEKAGVTFWYRARVDSLERRGNDITGVITSGQSLVADRYVLAAGSYTEGLARRVGVRVPVRPVKGYSVSIDRAPGEPTLSIPIVDNDLHAVMTPLTGVLRVAGTAEFCGFDLTPSPARVRNLTDLAQRILPRAHLNIESASAWCGLRPMSADGVPIIGPAPLSNLFVNTGHGHLGWTLAAGSGELLASLMCGEAPNVDPQLYSLTRFRRRR